MYPVLFVWRGLALRSFHVMTYAALLLAIIVATFFATASGLDGDRTALAVVLVFVPGFIGARLLYVARHWRHFRGDPARILRRSGGGLSLYGGVIGVFAGTVPVLWALAIPPAPFCDALVLGMMAGLVVAKGGCLLNGCCYGRPTGHWCAAHLPDDRGVWRLRFPSQLLEMAWAAIVFVVLVALRGAMLPAGLIACAGIALHPVGRLFLQKLRDEKAENAAVLKTCVSLIAAALLAGLLAWGR
ncbi:MAG: prolipoprotein diacylglyceryl transferase [Pseudolabrys sp.]